jgi:hypothetical protein
MLLKVRSKVQRINPVGVRRFEFGGNTCVPGQLNSPTSISGSTVCFYIKRRAYCCGCSTFLPNSGSTFAIAATIKPGIVAMNTQRKKFLYPSHS